MCFGATGSCLNIDESIAAIHFPRKHTLKLNRFHAFLETVNIGGSREAWGVVVNATPSVDNAVVTEYALLQNYPNPFNPSTNLVFDVVAENVVNLTVYNAMGQEVATLVNGTMAAGRHTVSFDAANLTSGLYFYTVKIGNEFTATKKMLLVK